jgi:hypothetical protein
MARLEWVICGSAVFVQIALLETYPNVYSLELRTLPLLAAWCYGSEILRDYIVLCKER